MLAGARGRTIIHQMVNSPGIGRKYFLCHPQIKILSFTALWTGFAKIPTLNTIIMWRRRRGCYGIPV